MAQQKQQKSGKRHLGSVRAAAGLSAKAGRRKPGSRPGLNREAAQTGRAMRRLVPAAPLAQFRVTVTPNAHRQVIDAFRAALRWQVT